MISNFGTISKLLFTFKVEKNDDMVGTFDQQDLDQVKRGGDFRSLHTRMFVIKIQIDCRLEELKE